MSTTIVTRPTEPPVHAGDHVRDELHVYTVDRVGDHLADSVADYVLDVHDEAGTRFTVFGSEVAVCGAHEHAVRASDAARELRAAGYRTRVSQLAPDRLVANLVRGSLHAMVFLSVRKVGIRAVLLYRTAPGNPAELLMFDFFTVRAGKPELFAVEDTISRALALADEVKATVR